MQSGLVVGMQSVLVVNSDYTNENTLSIALTRYSPRPPRRAAARAQTESLNLNTRQHTLGGITELAHMESCA